ncbi:putative ribosomal RNA-processing protein 7-like A [Apostichopus japonicus]|uniref:Putative ribosomal RNA-processing protein 7-like A n=1 Tax=Stichopus japonicus TaxID=307972 RepID=A0A2G8JN74_STIJA|nr:putative ribosomal RNA-processing protein 7-like A [Apostichopus japonicus]
MTGEPNSRKFHAIEVRFSKDRQVAQYLFYRKHISKEEDAKKPSDRTLFVANVPPYCNEECLQRLFGSFGKIESLHREEMSVLVAKETELTKQEKPGVNQVYSVAFIVFANFKILEDVIKKITKVEKLEADTSTYKTGMAKWCSAYAASRPDPEKLQTSVDTFMKEYDKEKEKKAELAKEQEGVPDEDGWITVTKKTKKKVVQRTEKKQQWLKAKAARKRKLKQHANFYTFQIKQSKRDRKF